MGFGQSGGYLKRKAFHLRFLELPGAVDWGWPPDFGRFPGKEGRHPLKRNMFP